MNQTVHVNKTNFHMKGFALGLALKQRRKATRKLPIVSELCIVIQIGYNLNRALKTMHPACSDKKQLGFLRRR